MKLGSLQLNPLSAAGLDWLTRLSSAFESRDIARFEAFLHDDVVLEINNSIPFIGKHTASMTLQRFGNRIGEVEYEPLNLYGDDHRFAAEMLAHHTPLNAAQPITLPMAIFYDRETSGLLTSMRVFVELEPVLGT